MTDAIEQQALLEMLRYRNEAIPLARQRLLYFTQFTKPDYSTNWHHRYVCDVLDRFSKQEMQRLMVFQAPQTGKSELVSRRLPAYLLGKNQNLRIALASYGADWSQTFNRDVQRIIDEEKYKMLFPKTTLSGKNAAQTSLGNYKRTADIFEIVGHKGWMKTVGIGGALTGSTVDVGLIDDPFKDRQEANSVTTRNMVWNWFTDVFETRLHNESQQLLTMTRWHEDDLAGRILKRDGDKKDGGKWVVLRLPALREDFSDPNDPREIGEAIWPEKHSRERMETIRADSPSTFASMYQQRPSPAEGHLLKKAYFKHYELHQLPEGTNHCYIDTATSEGELKTNDPTGILVYRVWQNKLYLIQFIKGMWSMPDLIEKIKWVAEKWLNGSRSKVWIENKSNGRSTKQLLDNATNLSVMLENIKYKKHERVENELPVLEAGRVLLPIGDSWVEDFMQQCLTFPNATHDEEVDCLTGAIRTGLGEDTTPRLTIMRRQ